MSPALHPPERPSHTHSPKPAGFGGSGHEIKSLNFSAANAPGIFGETSSRELGAATSHRIVKRGTSWAETITTQAVASAGQFVPAREPGSSKGPRRSETAQAVASAKQFVSARELGSSKGPRR